MQTLHPYPFEKLATLTRDVAHCGLPRIALTIGEPKHQPPAHVLDALVSSIEEVAKYPSIIGLTELRVAIAQWVEQRFNTRTLDPSTEVLPVNGTREEELWSIYYIQAYLHVQLVLIRLHYIFDICLFEQQNY